MSTTADNSSVMSPPAQKKRASSKHRILPLGKRFKNKMELLRKKIDKDTALLRAMIDKHEAALKEKRESVEALRPFDDDE